MKLLSRLFAKKFAAPVAGYSLYRPGSSTSEPDALWLSYEWDDALENREWRPCVRRFLRQVEMCGYEVKELPSPSFTPGEDFVEIELLVAGVRTSFTSDHLLSLIVITSEDPSVIRSVWNNIGNKVGWVT